MHQSEKERIPMASYAYYSEGYGNVIAVDLENAEGDLARTGGYKAWMAVLHGSSSPVTYGSVSPRYLDNSCVEVSEEEARLIHPKLFEMLDKDYEDSASE
jgi:hypothetical protein